MADFGHVDLDGRIHIDALVVAVADSGCIGVLEGCDGTEGYRLALALEIGEVDFALVVDLHWSYSMWLKKQPALC